MTNLDSILKSRDIALLTKICLIKAMVFLVVMYGCESWTIKKGWVLKKWYFWMWYYRRALTVPYKAINPKGNQPWIFIEKSDAEAEIPILWLPDVKNRIIGKDPDADSDWRQEKGMAEDKMIGWHQQLTGHKFEQAPGDGSRQGSLACYSPWDRKDSDMTEWLSNNKCMVSCHLQTVRVLLPFQSGLLFFPLLIWLP